LLFIVFKFENQRSDIFTSFLPLFDTLLSIWIELLVILIEQCFGSSSLFKLLFIVFLCLFGLIVYHFLMMITQLSIPLSDFFFFLLLKDSKLFVSYFPELRKLLFLLLRLLFFRVALIDLIFSRFFNLWL